ncbi:hypothetical protein [Streptomyces luteolus]|uniref:Uncharacterized protein n=1 Tax=Streptomyces luteolus TaxID=3043615 RepID=A0ABT6SZ71_9ACTN|nr:hypothetical protein [Streptomyces sp. B-S-A12]MDI3420899.1 hypothetical protein [Streptomyces sp. B-S-A12]
MSGVVRSRRVRGVLLALAVVLLAVAVVAGAGLRDPVHALQNQGGRTALMLASGVLGLVLAAFALLIPGAGNPGPGRRLVWLSACFSLLCIGATVFVWACVSSDDSLKGVPGTVVTTDAQTGRELAAQDRASQRRVPTGLLIETLQFTDTHNVRLTGYLWQRLPASADPDEPAVELPDAIDGGPAERVYRYTDGDQQVVGWRLRTTLREAFDYGHYPLDRQVVRLSMWPRDADTVLVPDFSAYPPWDTRHELGLYQHIVTAQWHPQFTAFSLGEVDDRTNYGQPGASVDSTMPELHFSTGLSREFLSPLLDRLVPLIVIACLVFASLFVITKDSERRALSGFSTWAVLGFCGAQMLIVAVQHGSLRGETSSSGVVYAEYFYFILYLVIALVAINVVEHTSTHRFRLLDWQGNAASRLLYWPTMTGLLLAVTIAVFLL